MAIAITNLASTADATDATAYAMPTVNIDKDSLILFTVVNSKGTSPDSASITGLLGATWEIVESVLSSVPVNTRHETWRTMISSSANTVALIADFGLNIQTGFVGIVDMVSGCATSNSNGAGAIVQSTFTSTSGTGTITITLPSVPTAAVYGTYSKQLNTSMGTPTGFTKTADAGQATPARRSMACYNLTAAQTWASTQTANAPMTAIAMEFLIQSTGTSATIRSTQRLIIGVGR